MRGDPTREPLFGFTSYPRDWLAFIRAPTRFLSGIETGTRAGRQRALEYFSVGLAGTIAFSALDLSHSGWQSAANQRLLQGEVINVGLLMGGATTALIATVLSWLMGGRASPRAALVTFGFTLGFLWPTTAAALILLSRAASALLGFDWTALPPFDTAILGHAPPTPINIALGAFFCALLIWAAAYALYCYAAALRVSQGVGLVPALAASGLAAGATDALGPWLALAANAVGERFGPLIEWLLRFA